MTKPAAKAGSKQQAKEKTTTIAVYTSDRKALLANAQPGQSVQDAVNSFLKAISSITKRLRFHWTGDNSIMDYENADGLQEIYTRLIKITPENSPFVIADREKLIAVEARIKEQDAKIAELETKQTANPAQKAEGIDFAIDKKQVLYVPKQDVIEAVASIYKLKPDELFDEANLPKWYTMLDESIRFTVKNKDLYIVQKNQTPK